MIYPPPIDSSFGFSQGDSSVGHVAKLVGIADGAQLLDSILLRFSGQVKRLLLWLDMEGVPAVDPSQGDLAASQQGPEQHAGRFGCGQDALGLDPALELLVEALDRSGRAH